MSDAFVGEVRLFGFPRLPNGWLRCDGSLYPISQYEVLFALIGTTYGGDGASTFATPNLAGRVPMHFGSRQATYYAIGQVGGSEQVRLNSGQLPPHVHSAVATQAPANSQGISSSTLLGKIANDTMYTNDMGGIGSALMSPASTSMTGAGAPHDNLMPTLTINFCIAYEGIFPSQG
jgi:microcystin-dependent protein